jgi:hypothetical protein
MEPKANSLFSGFHVAGDVAIATAVGLIAVLVCYPIYIVAVMVKAPLSGFNRWSKRDNAVKRAA